MASFAISYGGESLLFIYYILNRAIPTGLGPSYRVPYVYVNTKSATKLQLRRARTDIKMNCHSWPTSIHTVNFAYNDTQRGIKKVSLFAKCRYTRSLIIMYYRWKGLCSGHGNAVVIRELSLYPQSLLAKLTVLEKSVHFPFYMYMYILVIVYRVSTLDQCGNSNPPILVPADHPRKWVLRLKSLQEQQ